MSGAFSWQGNNAQGDGTHASPGYFDQTTSRAQQPSVVVKRVGTPTTQTSVPTPSIARPAPRPTLKSVAASHALSVPDGRQAQKTSGEIVLIIALDMTGSMAKWPEEILRRLPRLYQVACDYFGTQDVDVVFIAHGDARTDSYATQVGKIGRGQELELTLASFRPCGGGGQGSETPEIVAAYLRDQLDVSSARMVYTFFVTDEAGCDRIAPDLAKRELGIDVHGRELDTIKVFQGLAKRMRTFTVLCSTNCYPDLQDSIRDFWERAVGKEHVLPLDDARRVVEVMLGVFAKTTGQLDRFTRDMSAWHGGTKHGVQNVQTVMGSIALVGGQLPGVPKILPRTGTRALLPPGDDDGKK